MKLLTYLLLIYLAYRFFFQPMMLGAKDADKLRQQDKDDDEGDYIDYEEVK